jgi:hypothetical protein
MANKLIEPDLQLLKNAQFTFTKYLSKFVYFQPVTIFDSHFFPRYVTFINVEDAKNVQVFKKTAVLVMRIIGGGGGGDGGLKNGEIFGIILKKFYSDTDSVDH